MKADLIFAVIMGIFCVAFTSGGILWYRRRIKKFLNQILQRLDRAIGGEFVTVPYDESLEGAIGERLNRLVEINNSQTSQVKEEQKNMKALISDISHQVRTPLTNIMLYAGMLKEIGGEEAVPGMTLQIHRQAEKLDFFMKELVKTSYMETDMMAVNPSRTPVDELIKRACQMVEMQAMRKEIGFILEDTKVSAFFDLKWTLEALGNVLENAIKYSPLSSSIQIKTISYESFVCIQVQDEGIGIREEEQGAIFQRFYRSADVSEKKGMGIGLYLAREIIARQGGYIKVKSIYGKGSTFSLYLKVLA